MTNELLYEHRGYRYCFDKTLSEDGLTWNYTHNICLNGNIVRKLSIDSCYMLGEDGFKQAVDDYLTAMEWYAFTGFSTNGC